MMNQSLEIGYKTRHEKTPGPGPYGPGPGVVTARAARPSAYAAAAVTIALNWVPASETAPTR